VPTEPTEEPAEPGAVPVDGPAEEFAHLTVSPARFDELVADALDQIPATLAGAMDNVVVLTEDVHPEDPDLLGLYEGVPLTERTHDYAGALPDRITLYREPLQSICANEPELVHEVLVTVVHEIAHHFGIDEDVLHRLGWG
jgi:predicted Zn-dependent protease with MMP-like domain